MSDRPQPPSDHTEYTDEDTDDRRESPADQDPDSTFPFFVPFGWPTWSGSSEREESVDDEYGRTQPVAGEPDYGDDTWVDEGLITLVLLAGVALFLFPEPATSGLGVLLILAGATAWLLDWAL